MKFHKHFETDLMLLNIANKHKNKDDTTFIYMMYSKIFSILKVVVLKCRHNNLKGKMVIFWTVFWYPLTLLFNVTLKEILGKKFSPIVLTTKTLFLMYMYSYEIFIHQICNDKTQLNIRRVSG